MSFIPSYYFIVPKIVLSYFLTISKLHVSDSKTRRAFILLSTNAQTESNERSLGWKRTFVAFVNPQSEIDADESEEM